MKKIFTTIFVAYLITGTANVRGQDTIVYTSNAIKDIRTYLEKSRLDLVTLTQARRLLLLQYEAMVLTIGELKEKKEIGWYDRIQLKNLLKESEDLSQQFVKLDKLIMAHRETNEIKMEALLKYMTDEIEALVSRLEKTKRSDVELRETMSDTLISMIREKSSVQAQLTEPMDVDVKNIKFSRNDPAELLEQKADFLMDQHDKLTRYAKMIEQKIKKLQSDSRTNLHLKMVAEEMVFFHSTRDSKISFRQYHSEPIQNKTEENESDSSGVPYVEVHNTLPLSNIRVAPFDAPAVILQKLKYEYSLAMAQAGRFESTAKEVYWLSDFKKKRQMN